MSMSEEFVEDGAGLTPQESGAAAPSETSEPQETGAQDESSSADDEQGGLLDAVQKVLGDQDLPDDDLIDLTTDGTATEAQGSTEEPGSDQERDASAEDDGADAQADAQAETQEEEDQGPVQLSDEDRRAFRRLPGSVKRKVRRLEQERNAFYEDTQKVALLNDRLHKGNIDAETLNTLLELGSMYRTGNLDGFRQAITPFLRSVDEMTGHSLPEDLEAKVSEGHMTREAASDFAKERHARSAAESHAHQMHQQQLLHAEVTTGVQREQAVNDWQATAARNDPDFAKKEPMIRELLSQQADRLGTLTPQQAVALCNELHNKVTSWVRQNQPKPRATSPSPSSATPTSGARQEPGSLAEAALAGLRRAQL